MRKVNEYTVVLQSEIVNNTIEIRPIAILNNKDMIEEFKKLHSNKKLDFCNNIDFYFPETEKQRSRIVLDEI